MSSIFSLHQKSFLLNLYSFFFLSPFAFFLLSSCSYLPEDQEIPSVVEIYEYREYIEIHPNSGVFSKTGLVFYPGGLVDPHAYIEPLSRFAIAGKGHKVIIAKMPGNLALLDPYKGAWVYDDFPSVSQWVIAGHSLGGVMACSNVAKYPDFFKGIVLMASYPTTTTNLSKWDGSVLSIRGEFDGLTDSLTVASYQGLLPPPYWMKNDQDFPTSTDPKTLYFTIPGANHAQFGKYGPQKGDGLATLPPEKQYEAVASLILNFFKTNGWEYGQ